MRLGPSSRPARREIGQAPGAAERGAWRVVPGAAGGGRGRAGAPAGPRARAAALPGRRKEGGGGAGRPGRRRHGTGAQSGPPLGNGLAPAAGAEHFPQSCPAARRPACGGRLQAQAPRGAAPSCLKSRGFCSSRTPRGARFRSAGYLQSSSWEPGPPSRRASSRPWVLLKIRALGPALN